MNDNNIKDDEFYLAWIRIFDETPNDLKPALVRFAEACFNGKQYATALLYRVGRGELTREQILSRFRLEH